MRVFVVISTLDHSRHSFPNLCACFMPVPPQSHTQVALHTPSTDCGVSFIVIVKLPVAKRNRTEPRQHIRIGVQRAVSECPPLLALGVTTSTTALAFSLVHCKKRFICFCPGGSDGGVGTMGLGCLIVRITRARSYTRARPRTPRPAREFLNCGLLRALVDLCCLPRLMEI